MYGSLAFQPSQYSGLHYGSYLPDWLMYEPDEKGKPSAGVPGGTFGPAIPPSSVPKEGYPCVKKGATDGPSSGAVSAVQNALSTKFGTLLQIPSDHFRQRQTLGTFDDETDRIVRAFQDLQGLTADGIVGPVTGTKLGLKFQNCTRTIQTTAAPVDTGGGEPGVLQKINIRRQTDPILFYGTIGVVVLLAAGGYAVYRNERGR